MTIDLSQAMKDGMRRLASGVCVVSTVTNDGAPLAMTASSVTSVSDAPPSLLVCVNQTARMHDVLTPGHGFAVNVLSEVHEDVSIACSTGDQAASRFQTGQWDSSAALPTLDGALAIFECVVSAVHVYGTHSIVIGDIHAAKALDASISKPAPLVYYNGAYVELL